MFASENLASRFNVNRTGLVTAPPAGFCTGLEFDCSAAGPLPTTGYGGQFNPDGTLAIRPVGFVLPGDQVDNRTVNTAGYALVRFGPQGDARGISGNVGVRVVHIENEGSGFIQQNGGC